MIYKAVQEYEYIASDIDREIHFLLCGKLCLLYGFANIVKEISLMKSYNRICLVKKRDLTITQ